MERMTSFRMSVDELIITTGGYLVTGPAHATFTGVSTDSRHIGKGDLFVALRGDVFDGHDFVVESVRKGAGGVLICRGGKRSAGEVMGSVSVVAVEDTLVALGDIASFWRMKFSLPVVAVTGSSGKTTTKEMLAAVAGRTMHILKSRGNFNNLVGLPLSLLEMRGGHDAAIVEMGTNRPGEIGRLADIACPTVGVVTNIGPAHLEGFGSVAAIAEEKISLYDRIGRDGTAVVNADDDAIISRVKRLATRVLTFGIKRSADVQARHIERGAGTSMHFSIEMGGAAEPVTLPLIGGHNVYNALAAAAAAHALGVGLYDIREGLAGVTPPAGRMSVIRVKNGASIIDDSYNANPASVREALETVGHLRGSHKSFVILGDMLELGREAEALHEEAGRLCAATGSYRVLHIGSYADAVYRGARKAGMTPDHFLAGDEPGAVAGEIGASLDAGDWILVKGSRRMKMERYVAALIHTFGTGGDS